MNRPVTFRTIPRFWHPRTGITAVLLLLSATTELVVLNLIPQHDPHWALVDDSFADGVQNEFGGAVQTQLFKDVAAMRLYRVRTDE
jgi:hypothetical protein